MAAQPRPWFRLGSIVRPVGPAPVQPPTPAPAAAPTPTPAPTQLARTRTTLRPLAPPPPPEPTPPPPAVPTQPQPAAPVAQPQATTAPPPPPPTAVTTTNTSVPSSPARGVSSAPSASLANSPRPREASPPSPVIGITSGSSSVPPSPGNRVAPYSSSVVASPKATVTSSVPNSPATSRAVPPPQVSPPKSTAIANSVPQQTYSPPKPRSTNISSANAAREPSPNYNQSSRSIKPVNNTPPASPNRFKPTAPPPSPLNLPASQLKSNTVDQTDQPRIPLEAEQKTVLVQKTVDQKSNSWFGSGGSKQDRDLNRESSKPTTHSLNGKHEDKHFRKKLSSDSEEAPGMRVITIAGENKGAYMELIRSPNKHHEERGERSYFPFKRGNISKAGGQTTGSHESDQSYSTSSGEEGKPKIKDKNHHRGNKAGQSSQLPMSAYMNSNVQGINNSIMYNSSCTHHDPGVHLSLARKPSGDGFDVKKHANGHHS